MSDYWYNTISFSGTDLSAEKAKAKAQGELIMAIFKANPSVKLSPSQVLYIFSRKYHLHPPITSIRRAMTNLTNKDKVLVKTGIMVKGLYHLPENQWMLARNSENIYKKEIKSAGDIASEILRQAELF